VGVARALADSSDFELQGERTMMIRRAKFDAASFILGGEIRNHTNKQTHKQ